MKFYHGTTKENWEKIQEEGVLWGKPSWNETWEDREPNRYTYLTPDIEVAEAINSEVILEVEYDPIGVGNKVNGQVMDNYGFNPPQGQTCWQFSVFIPISIKKIKIKYEVLSRNN